MTESNTLHRLLSHAGWTRDLARSLVRDPNVADDIAQDAALVAIQRRPDPVVDARAWLARVVRNLAHRRVRSEVRRAARERERATSESVDQAERIDRADAHRLVASCVLELAEPYRTVLLQRYFDGMAPREIARLERCAVSTISNRLTRAHAVLRERLERDGDRQRWLVALAPLLAPQREAIAVILLAAKLWGSAWVLGGIVVALVIATAWALDSLADTPHRPPGSIVARRPIPTDGRDREPNSLPTAIVRRPTDDPPGAPREVASAPGTASLLARVVGVERLPPIADVVVRVTGRDGSQTRAATTDSGGYARLDGLAAGELTAVLEIGGEAWSETSQIVELDAGRTREIEWCVAMTSRVTGTILDARGLPLADEAVVLTNASGKAREFPSGSLEEKTVATAMSGPNGNFEFEGIAPGQYMIGPRGDPFVPKVDERGDPYLLARHDAPARVFERLDVPRNVPRIEVEVRAWQSLYLTGSAVFPDGAPAPNVTLTAHLSGVEGSLVAQSFDDGEFRFGPMPPGNYSIFGVAAPDGWGFYERVRADAGTSDLRLVLARSATVRGVVVGVGGAPIPGWLQVLQAEDGPRPRSGVGAQIAADADGGGAFEFEGLQPASYHVTFIATDGAWWGFAPNVVLRSGAVIDNLHLPLRPATRLTVENRATEGALGVDIRWNDRLFLERRVDPGRSVSQAVPDGAVEVRFVHRHTKSTARHHLDCVAGRAAELVFDPADDH